MHMDRYMEYQFDVSIGPQLVIRGALLGSILLSIFSFFLSNYLFNPEKLPSPISGSANQITTNQSLSTIQNNEDCSVSRKFSDDILQWCQEITTYSAKYVVSPDLIAAVMLQESGGNPTAYSHSGAVGLMQIMPRDGIASSFMCINGPCFANRPSINELQDPEFYVEFGTHMLANLIEKYGNIRDALKFYGPKDAGYSYADKVLAIYQNYR